MSETFHIESLTFITESQRVSQNKPAIFDMFLVSAFRRKYPRNRIFFFGVAELSERCVLHKHRDTQTHTYTQQFFLWRGGNHKGMYPTHKAKKHAHMHARMRTRGRARAHTHTHTHTNTLFCGTTELARTGVFHTPFTQNNNTH